jgi:hypothetical protein
MGPTLQRTPCSRHETVAIAARLQTETKIERLTYYCRAPPRLQPLAKVCPPQMKDTATRLSSHNDAGATNTPEPAARDKSSMIWPREHPKILAGSPGCSTAPYSTAHWCTPKAYGTAAHTHNSCQDPPPGPPGKERATRLWRGLRPSPSETTRLWRGLRPSSHPPPLGRLWKRGI